MLNVYYIDDEPDLLEMFQECFSSQEVKVTAFIDQKLFISTVQDNPPDLIFLDYKMPFLTGDELASLIDPRIPKILITGDLSVVPKNQFVAILAKPYDIQRVEALIYSFIK